MLFRLFGSLFVVAGFSLCCSLCLDLVLIVFYLFVFCLLMFMRLRCVCVCFIVLALFLVFWFRVACLIFMVREISYFVGTDCLVCL